MWKRSHKGCPLITCGPPSKSYSSSPHLPCYLSAWNHIEGFFRCSRMLQPLDHKNAGLHTAWRWTAGASCLDSNLWWVVEACQDGVLPGRFVPNLNVGMNSFEAKQTICIPSSNCQHITLVACRGSTKIRWPGWNEVQNQYIPSNRIWFCGVPRSVSMIVRVLLKAVCYEGRFDPSFDGAFFGILVGCQHHEFMASWFRLKNLLGNDTLGKWKTQELGWETNLGSFQIIRFLWENGHPRPPQIHLPQRLDFLSTAPLFIQRVLAKM